MNSAETVSCGPIHGHTGSLRLFFSLSLPPFLTLSIGGGGGGGASGGGGGGGGASGPPITLRCKPDVLSSLCPCPPLSCGQESHSFFIGHGRRNGWGGEAGEIPEELCLPSEPWGWSVLALFSSGWRREPIAGGGAAPARPDGSDGGLELRCFPGRLDVADGVEDQCLLTLRVWKVDGGSSGCPLPCRRV